MTFKTHYLILLLPLACVILYFTQGDFFYRGLLSFLCGTILVFYGEKRFYKQSLLLVAAGLFISIFADWFMGHSRDGDIYFIYGVCLFFLAHCCYLLFSLLNGKLHIKLLLGILAVYLPLFFFLFAPNIQESSIYVAVLLYLLISALSLAGAAGLSIKGVTRFLFFVGIGTLIISDTFIGFNMFSSTHFHGVVLPTYFAFQILITAALIRKS